MFDLPGSVVISVLCILCCRFLLTVRFNTIENCNERSIPSLACTSMAEGKYRGLGTIESYNRIKT